MAMEELTLSDIVTPPQPKQSEFHGGIIRVPVHLLSEYGASIRECNTQGKLEDSGVFAKAHEFLHLPKSYTIRVMLLRYPSFHEWEIGVESPDLPAVDEWCEPPLVTPVYYRDEDGTVHLIKIKIENRWERTYVSDGLTIERVGA